MVWLFQVLRGAALAGVIGAFFQAGSLIFGLTRGTSILVFPVAALAAVAVSLIPDTNRRIQSLGAVVAGVVASTSGVLTGVGSLEVSLFAGAVSAVVVLLFVELPKPESAHYWVLGVTAIAIVL